MQVFAGIITILWIVVAAGTIKQVITAKIFFAPCLGTDLYLLRLKEQKLQKESQTHKENV